jgi:RNA polymerase sigma factor (sigma-70 family)
MPFRRLARVLQDIRRTAIVSGAVPISDAQLLDAFVKNGDEAGFEALVRRYGPMVHSVCRRLLHHTHDAEDAFQVTFLVLARKAPSLRRREAVGNWLYGVAVRTALHARTRAARRRVKEAEIRPMTCQPSSAESAARQELHDKLDEELSRLPDKYRAPIVLCDLLGKTKRQAAEELCCPEGTVSSRLVRGRNLLRKRLANRGPAAPGGAEVGVFGLSALEAVPLALSTATVKLGLHIARGTIAAAGGLPPGVAVLFQGVMKSMLLAKLKQVVLFACTLSIVGAAASWYAWGSGPTTAPVQLLPSHTVKALAAVEEQESAAQPPAKKDQFLYKGKDFTTWKAMLTTELDPERQVEAIKALGVFGVNGFAEESTAAIMEVVKRKDARGQFEMDDARIIDIAQSTIASIGTKSLPVIDQELESKKVNDRRWAAWTLNCMMVRYTTGAIFYSGYPVPGSGTATAGVLGASGIYGGGGLGAAYSGAGFGAGIPAGGFGAAGIGAGFPGLPGAGIGAGFPAAGIGAGFPAAGIGGFSAGGIPAAGLGPLVWSAVPPSARKELRVEVFPHLLHALKDSDRLVRNFALQGIAQTHPYSDVAIMLPFEPKAADKQLLADLLLQPLKDEDSLIRLRAVMVIGWLGPDIKSTVDVLANALKDDSAQVKSVAIQALDRIGPAAARAVPALEALIARTQEEESLRGEAEEALKKIRK